MKLNNLPKITKVGLPTPSRDPNDDIFRGENEDPRTPSQWKEDVKDKKITKVYHKPAPFDVAAFIDTNTDCQRKIDLLKEIINANNQIIKSCTNKDQVRVQSSRMTVKQNQSILTIRECTKTNPAKNGV